MIVNIRYVFSILTIALLIIWAGCNCNSHNNIKRKEIAIDTNKNKRLCFLTYGLQGEESIRDVIADKWGIEFFTVAGCMVSEHLKDSAEKHNKEVEILIENKYGKFWKTSFEKEMEAESVKREIASALLDKERTIITKQSILEKEGNVLLYNYKILAENEYEVSVSGWGLIQGKKEYISYFRYLVNTNNKKVKLISDSLKKE